MKYKVTLNGKCYEVVVEKGEAVCEVVYDAPTAAAAAPAAAAPASPAAAPAAPAGAGEAVTAPMPGTVLNVKVTQGQSVKKGDILIILEAMKMENEITAPRDGVVSQIVAAKGAAVDTDAPLVILA